MISAVIFDFNGVLVDDESVHFDLFREVLGQEGVPLTDREYHERYLGYDDAGCFEHVLHDAGRETTPEYIAGLIARRIVMPWARWCSSAAKGPVAVRASGLRS